MTKSFDELFAPKAMSLDELFAAIQPPPLLPVSYPSHDLLMPLAKHMFPELAESISWGFTSILAFIGPLGVQKLFDGVLRKFGVGQ